MKLLILSFYFQPDLCAGSFRCSALVDQLKKIPDLDVDIVTTLPNRYASFSSEALEFESVGNTNVHRIRLPIHKSGMLDQAKAFFSYYTSVIKIVEGKEYDAVYATSSRLFTAFLGSRVSRKLNVPLYLDIRDIFVDTIKDVLPKTFTVLSKPVFSWLENYTFGRARKINLVSKGFEQYFRGRYPDKEYSWFTNGIDEVFLRATTEFGKCKSNEDRQVILYAGNIGEGQGLHTIVPGLAKTLGENVTVKIIGDGGKKQDLQKALQAQHIENVVLLPPVDRQKLIEEYENADVLFLHLNDYPAFEKVLPSKIFEYAAMGKPILAGVNGYSASFLRKEVENSAVFYPGDHEKGALAFESLSLEVRDRNTFVQRFSRSKIMELMAADIVSLMKKEMLSK